MEAGTGIGCGGDRTGEARRRRNSYRGFAQARATLRDQLAVDRTAMANERTLLAYSRTALALIATGVGCIKFFDAVVLSVAGWALIGLGLVAAGFGTWRTVRLARRLAALDCSARAAPDHSFPAPAPEAPAADVAR